MAARRPHWIHFLGYLPIQGFLSLSRLLPFRRRIDLAASFLGGVVRYARAPRERVVGNLKRVFPDMSVEDRLAFCRANGRSMGRTIAEILFGPDHQKHHLPITADGAGLEHLIAAQKDSRPVILVSAHLGQWDAVRICLREDHQIEAGALYRPNNNPYYEELFKRGALASGGPLAPRSNEGFRTLVKHLRSGGVFAILADQHIYTGAWLPFLGHPAQTTLSPAELALKYDALLIPAYGLRRAAEDGFDVVFEPPIPPSTPEEMMGQVNDSISTMIQKHPEQWLWLHRRWKKTRT
ncbi:MAG: lysophospholipid acyltransferase family protein [Pseudomonadota bacterium]